MMSCSSIRILFCLLVCSEAVLREVTDAAAQRAAPGLAADEAEAVRRLFGAAASSQPDENVCNWESVKCTSGGHLDDEMHLRNVDGVSECAKALVRLQRLSTGGKEKSFEYYKILPWLTGVTDLSDADKKKLMQFRMRVKGFPVILASGSNPLSPEGSPCCDVERDQFAPCCFHPYYPKSKLGFDRGDLKAFAKTIQEEYKQYGYALYDERRDNEFATIFGADMVTAKVHTACQRNETDSDMDPQLFQLKDNFWRAVWTRYVESWDSVQFGNSYFIALEGPADTFEQTDMYKYILPAVRSYQLPKKEWKAKMYLTCDHTTSGTNKCRERATCADYVKANYFQGLSGTCSDCGLGRSDQYPVSLSSCLHNGVYDKKTYIEDGVDVGKSGRKKRAT